MLRTAPFVSVWRPGTAFCPRPPRRTGRSGRRTDGPGGLSSSRGRLEVVDCGRLEGRRPESPRRQRERRRGGVGRRWPDCNAAWRFASDSSDLDPCGGRRWRSRCSALSGLEIMGAHSTGARPAAHPWLSLIATGVLADSHGNGREHATRLDRATPLSWPAVPRDHRLAGTGEPLSGVRRHPRPRLSDSGREPIDVRQLLSKHVRGRGRAQARRRPPAARRWLVGR